MQLRRLGIGLAVAACAAVIRGADHNRVPATSGIRSPRHECGCPQTVPSSQPGELDVGLFFQKNRDRRQRGLPLGRGDNQ